MQCEERNRITRFSDSKSYFTNPIFLSLNPECHSLPLACVPAESFRLSPSKMESGNILYDPLLAPLSVTADNMFSSYLLVTILISSLWFSSPPCYLCTQHVISSSPAFTSHFPLSPSVVTLITSLACQCAQLSTSQSAIFICCCSIR